MDIRRHFGVTPANSAKPQIIPAAPVVKSKSSQIDESGKKPLKTTKGSSKPSESPKHKPRPKKHSNPEDGNVSAIFLPIRLTVSVSDSGADSEDPIPRKYREKNKKQKTKSPAKQKSGSLPYIVAKLIYP